MKKGSSFSKLLAVLLSLLMLVSVLPMSAFAAVDLTEDTFPDDTYLISKTDYSIAPGVEETHLILNNADGTRQNMGYAMTVQLGSSATVLASYKDQDGTKDGLQTVRDQAKAAERKREVNGEKFTVVGGVNGNIFNMANGADFGYLVMDGKEYYHNERNQPYFAILNDGTAVIRDASVPPTDCKEAIGLWEICVRDGVNLHGSGGSYNTADQPRTAVGIKADGSVVLFVMDGRQAPKSSGMSWSEIADMMISLGCVTAGHLDGGGSTTFVSKHEGESELQVTSSPSDGVERAVASSLLVVSTAKPTGVFDHANLTPNNEIYTPGSQVQFTAKGVDSSGAAVDLPADGVFALADESFGSITEDGLFTANDRTGTVTVNYLSGGEVCGSVSIEIQNPDELYFATDEISLGFEAETDFGLTARYMGRDVHIKAGDIIWNATNAETGEDCLGVIGTFDGNTFTSADGITITANVTATYAGEGGLSATIRAIIGMLPTLVWDFEDPDYYTIDTEGSNFKTGTAGRGAIASAEIVSIYDDEPVRFGEHSLKLNYDFQTNSVSGTDGSYFGMVENFDVPGTPTGFGVWVYAPEGTANFWLRGYIYNNNDFSKVTPVDFTLQTSQATEDTPAGIYWSGWKYLEADLTNIAPPYTLASGYTFRLMYVPGINMGTQSKGSIYLDNLQFVYGANIDDVDAPAVNSIMVNDTEIESGVTTVDSNTVTFQASYADVENKYTTGVDIVRMYVDGVEVTGNSNFVVTADNICYLYDAELADGAHTVRLVIRDGFGNETEETRTFFVKGETVYPSVKAALTAAPLLGKTADLALSAEPAEAISEAEIAISVSGGYQFDSIEFAPAYAGSTYELDEKNNILTISAKRNLDVATDGALGVVRYAIPAATFEGSSFTYSVNGTFTAVDALPEGFIPSFATGTVSALVEAKYAISADPMLVGTEGVVTVVDIDGNPVAGANVYMADSGTLVGTTDGNGQVVSAAITAAIGSVRLYAEKDGDVSFVRSVDINSIPAELTDGKPTNVITPATTNGSNSKAFSWLSNPLYTAENAVVMLAEKAAYDAEGDAAFTTYTGVCSDLNMTASKNTVRSNRVTVTGLKAGVEYVYKVGDGSDENWSDVYSFTLDPLHSDTSFYVLADIQDADIAFVQSLMSTLAASDKNYSFSIQTGDSVDNAGNYENWVHTLSLYQAEVAGDVDAIHVLGNHEHESDLSGANAQAIYNLADGSYGSAYSVQYGNVYVAVINYTQNAQQLQDALAWLVEDANASDATWKVLTMHQPPYYTNPTGGNGYINTYVPAAVDEAGIDVVFSGHDHSYARTYPLTAGEVDEESGAVYYICGSTGEKSYDIVPNDAFHFAMLEDEFEAIYLSVSTTDTTFTVETHSVSPDGSDMIIDSYAVEKEVTCTESGEHAYEYDSGNLICSVCGYTRAAGNYTGLLTDRTNGKKLYLYMGTPRTNAWQAIEDDYYYLGSDGYAVTGTVEITESITTARAEVEDFLFNGEPTTLTYVFDADGKLVRGSDVYANGARYYVYAGVLQYGWWHIDGDWYMFDGVRKEQSYGKMLTGVWERNYQKFECDANGKLIKGWVSEDPASGAIRYFWANSYVTGLCDVDGLYFNSSKTLKGTFYFDPETGYMVTDAEIEIDGKTYLFGSDGRGLNGLVDADGGKVLCVDGEVMSGWQTVDGDRYYCDPGNDNLVATGQVTIDGELYTFNSEGVLMHEGDHVDADGDGDCDICDRNLGDMLAAFIDIITRIFEMLTALLNAFA